eukprot:TRINITY_DN28004_c0_g1_i1.p1 TRINITY_DN28004_c0_g1~~TRINITY_DN28004_c0_g1_i1.p1  ORF type:complete len:211 (+),score=21.51 TRINITY_DN28004_c0_g1_i1:833-1465(+)
MVNPIAKHLLAAMTLDAGLQADDFVAFQKIVCHWTTAKRIALGERWCSARCWYGPGANLPQNLEQAEVNFKGASLSFVAGLQYDAKLVAQLQNCSSIYSLKSNEPAVEALFGGWIRGHNMAEKDLFVEALQCKFSSQGQRSAAETKSATVVKFFAAHDALCYPFIVGTADTATITPRKGSICLNAIGLLQFMAPLGWRQVHLVKAGACIA